MFRLSRYHIIVVFLVAGLMTVIFTYATLNLFQMSMANFRFLREFGWTAVQEGGLIQLAQIVGSGTVALLSFFGFKICEVEIVQRYHKWQNR